MKISTNHTRNAALGETDKPEEFYAYIETTHDWMDKRIKAILQSRLTNLVFVVSLEDLPQNNHHLIQFVNHDWGNKRAFNAHFQAGQYSLINAFPNVDALSRKDHMARVVSYWMAKFPDTILRDHVPTTIAFEVDYAEWLEDALAEADSYELTQSLESNMEKDPSEREWWILKPAMCDRGDGIRMFSTLDELTGCFESLEDAEADEASLHNMSTTVPSSYLRQFVAQKYIGSPRMLSNKKFHVRSYALALGRLKVFVYRDMLVLSTSEDYQPPWMARNPRSYLTNTAIQGPQHARSFWDVDESSMPQACKDDVFDQICKVSAEIFRAAARTKGSQFNVVHGSFEVFGLDFLIDATGSAWLLEVNSGPADDNKELTTRMLNSVIYTVLRQTLGSQIADDKAVDATMVEVLGEVFGKSNIVGIWK